jgi:signal transduction histidine kinase
VRAITAQASTITGGTLSERVPVPASGDEIATLAITVNGMLDRLESNDVRRRRFVSDASHELRTPVAVLQSEAEVALRSPDRTDVEALASGVLEESTRMATIIDDLLSLARHDEGVAAPTTEIDLDDIVLAEASRLRRVPVDVSAVSAGRVLGRPDELARVVAHLLDNATRHANERVAVSLTSTAAAVTLLVDDDGPGVPEAQRAAIFERFTRLDEARSRDAGGAGLGLAVVAGVVHRCGGSVSVESSDLGGARFVVSLPAP